MYIGETSYIKYFFNKSTNPRFKGVNTKEEIIVIYLPPISLPPFIENQTGSCVIPSLYISTSFNR